MADSSFDIVSKVERQEVDNALNQAVKEIEQRYDFKGTNASISWSGEKILMQANGEERVNALNERAYEVAIRQAKRQLGDAEAGLRKAQAALTAFRKGQSDIDPEGSGEAQLRLVAELRKDQALAAAEMQAIASQIGTNNPQYQALKSRAAAISEQLNSQQSMLVGNSKSIASRLGDYQELQLRQEFESKRYSSAAASLEAAREQALRQQLFVVRLVQPSYPVKATYPKGLRGTVAVFLVLMLSYGIAWLLIAGVREHAA